MKKSEGGVCGDIRRGHKQVKVAYVKKNTITERDK